MLAQGVESLPLKLGTQHMATDWAGTGFCVHFWIELVDGRFILSVSLSNKMKMIKIF